jgi:hypothetical protein
MGTKVIVLIAIVLCTVIAVGEIEVYTNGEGYDSSVDLSGNGISYSVTSPRSNVYDFIAMDNGALDPIKRLYIYGDRDYTPDPVQATADVGAGSIIEEDYTSQLTKVLRNRGFNAFESVNAAELRSSMENDIDDGDLPKGLLVVSGNLPNTVYTGSTEDLVFSWLNAGGRLFWVGNPIGSSYATADGTVSVKGYQELFFGKECLNIGGTSSAYSEADNEFGKRLSLLNNKVDYAVNTGLLENALGIGYEQDGYSSIALIKFGEGTICVVGGDYSSNQRSDLAHVIASGINWNSEILGTDDGSVRRSTVHSSVDIPETHGNISVYIHVGGDFTVYGRAFSLGPETAP